MDVLAGYTRRDSSAHKTLEELKTCRREKRYEEGMQKAKKALTNYPNSFPVVYESAKLFYEAAGRTRSREAYQTALKLLDKACGLLAQNEDETVSELYIRSLMAEIFFQMGDTETCMEIWKRLQEG